MNPSAPDRKSGGAFGVEKANRKGTPMIYEPNLSVKAVCDDMDGMTGLAACNGFQCGGWYYERAGNAVVAWHERASFISIHGDWVIAIR